MLAAVSDITLIGFGAIDVAIALIYLHLSKTGGNGGGGAATSNVNPAISLKTTKIRRTENIMTEKLQLTNQIVKSLVAFNFLTRFLEYGRIQNLGWSFLVNSSS